MSSRAEIADALARSGGFVSGHALAENLGISRSAVWKHVTALRRAGYRIEGSRARGYRLIAAPQALTESAIRSYVQDSRLGIDITVLASTGSTNDDAAARARVGAPEGTVVIAERQSAGRGRLGRTWISPAGLNLALSCVLRPSVPPALAPRLSLVAALAVACALEELGFEPGIKWPNDVFLEGRKVCGILTEIEAEADSVRFVVVGIGLNVNGDTQDFPPELRGSATSLRMVSGRTWDRARVAGILLRALGEWYERFLTGPFAAVTADWNRRSILSGRTVRVDAPGGALEGRCRGIDTDGALLLDDGREVRRVIAGDASVVGGIEP